jgi:hypothetical protein
MAARLGVMTVVKAGARKLARLLHAVPSKGMVYVDRGMAVAEKRSAQRSRGHLTRRAAALGCILAGKSTEASRKAPADQ